MNTTTSLKASRSDKAIGAILAACYPEWTGRKVRIRIAVNYQMSDYWSEGSRNFVRAYDLTTGKVAEAIGLAQIPMSHLAHAIVAIPTGVLLVEHSIFCGKDAGVTVHVRMEDLARMPLAGRSSLANLADGAVS